jgi:transposase
MKDVSQFTRIFIATAPVDFRKHAHGLVTIAKETLAEQPNDAKSLFVFTNRKKNAIKMVYWDLTGYALWWKVLEKDNFFWPKGASEAKTIFTQRQLKWLLQGVDLEKIKTHEPVNFEKIL